MLPESDLNGKNNVHLLITNKGELLAVLIHADSPFVLNVLVDAAGNHHGDQRIEPGRDEHEREAQTHPQEGERPGQRSMWTQRVLESEALFLRLSLAGGSLGSPVVEFKARSPVGGSQKSLDSAGQVHKQIAHEEKPEEAHRWVEMKQSITSRSICLHVYLLRAWKHRHGEDRGHCIDGGDEDSNLADGHRQQQSPGGLTVRLAMTEDLKQPESLYRENTASSYVKKKNMA